MQELEQRYRDFRVAVQKANDAGEVTTYKALAQQWKAKAAAAVAASSHPMPVTVKPSVDKDGQKLESTGMGTWGSMHTSRHQCRNLGVSDDIWPLALTPGV